MPFKLPEDNKQIPSYGKHALEGLFYSPSNRCLYSKTRRINIDGRKGFYTKAKDEEGKSRSIYISVKNLIKQHELVDVIDWAKPEGKPKDEEDKNETKPEDKSNSDYEGAFEMMERAVK